MHTAESLKKTIQGATSHHISDLQIEYRAHSGFVSWGGSFPVGGLYTITVFVKLGLEFILQQEIRRHYHDFQGAMRDHGARFIFPDCSDNLHCMLTNCQLMAIPADMSHSAVLEFQTWGLDDFSREMEQAARARYGREFDAQVDSALALS